MNGTLYLLNIAKKINIPFVFVSSGAVFSSFNSMIWGKPLLRSTVQGEVSILSEKKELSEKQKILLDNLKSKK